MEEIKVGEYVRNKFGIIRKVISIDAHYLYLDKYYYEKNEVEETYESYDFMFDDEILKHSLNLIDLIEEGDYVNGDRMDIVEKDEKGYTYYLQNCELPSVDLKDIKSIITHEQFAQIEYKVEE